MCEWVNMGRLTQLSRHRATQLLEEHNLGANGSVNLWKSVLECVRVVDGRRPRQQLPQGGWLLEVVEVGG